MLYPFSFAEGKFDEVGLISVMLPFLLNGNASTADDAACRHSLPLGIFGELRPIEKFRDPDRSCHVGVLLPVCPAAPCIASAFSKLCNRFETALPEDSPASDECLLLAHGKRPTRASLPVKDPLDAARPSLGIPQKWWLECHQAGACSYYPTYLIP